MSINTTDGTFGLDCFEDANSTGEPDLILYSENVAELREEAARLIRGSRFKLCELYRYNYEEDDWDFLSEYK